MNIVDTIKGMTPNNSALKDYDYDPSSGAFINRKPSPAKAKMEMKELKDKVEKIDEKLEAVDTVKSDVDSLKGDMQEIKDLLRNLTSS